ncbi:RNA polymerase sigma factor SigZ [Poriferisphaera corsica]|uniref:RNA polymerase sigma factor SigZ n=1 Tax=Poriferisphaera corsica TaxID=2528020 RepID=A0A517YTL1_9BACT|nr:sigma-70 family RNA polymerase sigma factor [Poriferisphaera corsica]QDU33512.1 RNA polymerase sigma factor SigZ [Poriferisphaera corsica]
MQERLQELVNRYIQTLDENTFADLVSEVTPYITSICRKYIEDSADTDDAIQETLIKFANHLQNIHSNHLAWLARTARNTAISINRHQQSQRLRRETKATLPEHTIPWESLYYRLDHALNQISKEYQSYIIHHHIQHKPLYQIAEQKQISKSTASRRLADAQYALRSTFKEMQLDTYDDLCNDHLFVSAVLNYTPEHVAPTNTHLLPMSPHKRDRTLKPIRIGIFISQQSHMLRSKHGTRLHFAFQLINMGRITHPNLHIVGLIEPGSIDYGPVEASLREFSFNAGYMDATNAEALKTLDVITLGYNFAISPTIIRAITEAVESGVGLLNEGHCGGAIPGHHHHSLQNLMLAQSYLGYHHVHPNICHIPLKSTVLKRHPIIQGLAPGDSLSIPGCGPVFIPKPETTILLQNDQAVLPTSHHYRIACPKPTRKPILVVGNIGSGRVIVNTSFFFDSIGSHKSMQGDFTLNMLNYLAEPRLNQKLQAMTYT